MHLLLLLFVLFQDKKPEPCTTLVGAWRSPNMIINLGADGKTVIGGMNYRYTTDGSTMTLTGSDGVFRIPYVLRDGVLTVTLNGQPVALACIPPGKGGPNPPELVGKWSYLSSVNLSSGGRMSNSYVLLRADGTYEYFSETSSSNPNGSAVSSDRDYGTWTATASTLTARSRVRGTETVYTLEKRNHPKNKDPMILLNGQAFVTVTQRPPW